MRKILFFLLALPFIGLAQTKNLISTSRYFPKSGKWQAFEKAISAHAKKYHKNDFAWRVYTIDSGPDAGGYMVVEGPHNWGSVDTRGDLGAAHTADWETTVQVHLQDNFSSTYYEYSSDLSTAPIVQFADHISIQHMFVNPGFRGEVMDNIRASKKLWQADAMNVAVYDVSLSGQPQFAIVTRYVDGLKVRDAVNPVPFVERFNKANGEGSFDQWVKNYKVAVRNQWSELLTAKKDLGSN